MALSTADKETPIKHLRDHHHHHYLCLREAPTATATTGAESTGTAQYANDW